MMPYRKTKDRNEEKEMELRLVPMTWEEFTKLSVEEKKEYIKMLQRNFYVTQGSLAEMFGVFDTTLRYHFNKLNINIPKLNQQDRGIAYRKRLQEFRDWWKPYIVRNDNMNDENPAMIPQNVLALKCSKETAIDLRRMFIAKSVELQNNKSDDIGKWIYLLTQVQEFIDSKG